MDIQPSVQPYISKLPIRIHVGSTYIALYSDPQGYVGPGFTIAPFIRMYLQEREWVIPQGEMGRPLPGRWMTVANYTWRDSSGMARLPRYILDDLVNYLGPSNVELIPLPPVVPHPVKIEMKRRFELRDNQHQPVAYLLDTHRPFKPFNLQTGFGKTTVSLYAISQLGMPAIVILPTLIKQWYDRIKEFTTLRKQDIFAIQGYNSLKLLWQAVERGYQPKIILAAMRTLYMYGVDPKGMYADLPSWDKLQAKLGLGISVFDEVHMWFTANVKLQLTMNLMYNIFLSATFARTQWKQDEIFQKIFPVALRYAPDKVNKYTTVNVIEYSLGIDQDSSLKFTSPKFGYNHARYEKFLLRHPMFLNTFIDRVIIPLINMYYINNKNKGQKCLILNWTRAISKHMLDKIKPQYPNLKVNVYFSGQTPESNLKDSDIIISTHKSCGTGTDIKGLKTCINTVSFGSPVLAQQVMGRLREIPNEDVFFVDIWNRDVGKHQNHKFDRVRVYKQHAKIVLESQIS